MTIKNISANELRKKIKNEKEKIEIIDVREPEEYKIIHIKNSKLIPLAQLKSRLDEINWEKEVIFICRSGSRSRNISETLSNLGKKVTNLQFGIFECWEDDKGENLEILNENLIRNYF